MKKYLNILIIIVFAFASCKKDESVAFYGEEAGDDVGNSVFVGDILLADNTIVSPLDYDKVSNARGVVFYVDQSGKHGTALALNDISGCVWGPNVNVTQVHDYHQLEDAVCDYLGYRNTKNILSQSNSSSYQAAYHSSEYNDGTGNWHWYLPALGELNEIFKNKDVINSTLSIINGSTMMSFSLCWSSTECSSNEAWCFYLGNVDCFAKEKEMRVRPVVAF